MIKICGITPEMRSCNIFFIICVGFFNCCMSTLLLVTICTAVFVMFSFDLDADIISLHLCFYFPFIAKDAD